MDLHPLTLFSGRCCTSDLIPPPSNPWKETDMTNVQPAPDTALAEDPLGYTDPDLRAYTDEQAEDILESVVHHMPIILPLAAAVLIFMLAFIAVFMA